MGAPELSISGAVATITLQRPDQSNRLEPGDLAVLASHIAHVNGLPEVLVLCLQSTGKYFCSGYDIGSLGAERTVDFDEMVDALEDARPVTIAVIQGGIYGGATDLALACDFRLGANGIDMFMPAARLGLHFYPRGLQRYASRLGVDTAKRLFLTAERIGAEEMKRIGFLTQLVTPDTLPEVAGTLAKTLSGMAPLAMLGMKKHLTTIARGTFDATAVREDMARAAASKDLAEGRAAWAEKRKPRFTGQ